MRSLKSMIPVALAAVMISLGLATAAQGEIIFGNRRSESRVDGYFPASIEGYDTATGADVTPAGFATSYTTGKEVEGLAYYGGKIYAASGGAPSGTAGEVRYFNATTGAYLGYYTATIGSGQVRGLAFDSDGNLYCGLSNGDDIVKISSGGTDIDYHWASGRSNCGDMEIIGDKLYVGSGNNNSGIYIYDLDTGNHTQPSGLSTKTNGIAFAPDGTLYTVDRGDWVKVWTVDGDGNYSYNSSASFSISNSQLDEIDYFDGCLYINRKGGIAKYDLTTSTLTPYWQTYTGVPQTGQGLVIIPEPGMLVLLASGLIGLLAYAWRKRR